VKFTFVVNRSLLCLAIAGACMSLHAQPQDDRRDIAPSGKGIGTLQHPGQSSGQPGAKSHPGSGGNGILIMAVR
jgi:hypothetical protein